MTSQSKGRLNRFFTFIPPDDCDRTWYVFAGTRLAGLFVSVMWLYMAFDYMALYHFDWSLVPELDPENRRSSILFLFRVSMIACWLVSILYVGLFYYDLKIRKKNLPLKWEGLTRSWKGLIGGPIVVIVLFLLQYFNISQYYNNGTFGAACFFSLIGQAGFVMATLLLIQFVVVYLPFYFNKSLPSKGEK